MKIQFPWKDKTIYCVPNRFGLIYLFTFIAFLLAGAAYANNLVFMAGFFILSLVFIIILQTAKTIRGIEILSIEVQPKPAGEKSIGKILIKNPSPYSRCRLEIEIKELQAKFKIAQLLPYDVQTFEFEVMLPNKRGFHKINRALLRTESPYGLFRAWMYFKRNDNFIVYPKPHGHLKPPAQPHHSGDSFSGHKQFVTGDSLSRVDWKIFARTNNLWTKEYNDSSEAKTLFTWDSLKSMDAEDRISQLALWIQSAHMDGLDYGLDIPGYKSNILTGNTHYHACMKQLGIFNT